MADQIEGHAPESVNAQKDLYQVVVVNYSRQEEMTPILLTLASSDEEAESIIRNRLAAEWQREQLDFFVKLFKN